MDIRIHRVERRDTVTVQLPPYGHSRMERHISVPVNLEVDTPSHIRSYVTSELQLREKRQRLTFVVGGDVVELPMGGDAPLVTFGVRSATELSVEVLPGMDELSITLLPKSEKEYPFTIYAEDSDTIGHVKEIIMRVKSQWEVGRQRLWFDGRQLTNDNDTVASLGLFDRAELFVELLAHPSVVVETPEEYFGAMIDGKQPPQRLAPSTRRDGEENHNNGGIRRNSSQCSLM